MIKKDLIISLFVHDIKVPLAVIDAGARSLPGNTERHPPLSAEQMELLAEISRKKIRAVSVLDRILGAEQSNKTGPPVVDSAWPSRLPRRLTKWLSRFLKKPQGPQKSKQAVAALNELRAILFAVAEKISLLQISVDSDSALTPKRTKTTRRMLRNAKLALHLVDNARHLIGPGGAAVEPAGCKISEIVERALLAVFDVMDPSISEPLQSCEALSDIDAILAGAGVFLSIDERLWDTAYRLDCGKTSQVILNLLLNAMKFRTSRIDFSVRRKDGQLVFSVKDDGEGIPAARHDRIFENKFQAGPRDDFPIRGHGIGLAGSQALLQEMNGRLLLESDGRRFTCFSAVIDCLPDGEADS